MTRGYIKVNEIDNISVEATSLRFCDKVSMLFYCSLLIFFFLSSVVSTSFQIGSRRQELAKLIEHKTHNEASESVKKLAEVLAWFNEDYFSKEIIKIIFEGAPMSERLTDAQINMVLNGFKVDGVRQSAINAFYSRLPETHQSSRVVEKNSTGYKLNFAFKDSLKNGFILISSLNKIWNENYQCQQILTQPWQKWKKVRQNLVAKN